jgi:GT2 family glycosyltransferase
MTNTIENMNESGCNRTVDIIIPVYNAFEDLQICLNSISKYTDLACNRIIIVNDCSPDKRIEPYLNDHVSKNVIVIHNEVNKGFCNSINIGMSQSDENDVLFLNSDTVVTRNWLVKIQACAYRDSSIATVTPLSNNATLCSVPVFCEENPLPEGMTIDEAASIVEKCSLHRYPRITGAHGFCMYVKREVIRKIGMLDEETFGRGYGEENDFCYRASLIGYHHVMCDDTYIYHSGTKSFESKEKQEYIDSHLAILRDRYPELTRENDIHCAVNPNHWIGDNIGLHFKIHNGKKNILYVLHSDFKEGANDNVGGTQFHVKDLVDSQRHCFNTFVAARDKEYLNLTIYFEDSETELRYYIGPKSSTFEFHNELLGTLFDNIINAFEISLIHVHQVSSLSFDIFYVAKKNGVPIVFTAHDYFFICPGTRMLDCDNKVCVGKDYPTKCNKCLRSIKGIASQVEYIAMWREECVKALDICDYIIVPYENNIEIWNKYYPQFAEKIKVIEHGHDNNTYAEVRYDGESNDIHFFVESIIREGNTYRISGWGRYVNKVDKA